MRVLVTGGAGYIGSHTVLALLRAGHEPFILDDFSNAEEAVIARLERASGVTIPYVRADFGDAQAVRTALDQSKCEALIHFGAFKAVGESVAEPLKYYRNNVGSFAHLLNVVTDHGIKHVIFSSTAAVYGTPTRPAVTERNPLKPESPYGRSKMMAEQILQDACAADSGLTGTVLRYFNVVGADPAGAIGEQSRLAPANLLPIVVEAAAGTRPPLVVYGNDYPTADGTCERDYVHVSDLAAAHVAALSRSTAKADHRYRIYNISTGTPTSVLGLISAFERVNNVKVPYTIGLRRPGDPSTYYAVAARAQRELRWQAERTIAEACSDAWKWQQITHSNQ